MKAETVARSGITRTDLFVETRPSPDQVFFQTLLETEFLCTNQRVDHRFVGGTVTGLFKYNRDTGLLDTRMDVDPVKREIRLALTNRPRMFRENGTVTDVDFVCLCPDESKMEIINGGFRNIARQTSRLGYRPPYVSAEFVRRFNSEHQNGTLFQRNIKERLKQMVTVFEIDQNGQLYLGLDPVRVPISRESVAPWHLIDEDSGLKITTFNPYAHALCYGIRMAIGNSGYKQKDVLPDPSYNGQNKIDIVSRMAEEFARQYQGKTGRDIREEYQDWHEYRWLLATSGDGWTTIKRRIGKLYWDHGGGDLSQGNGGPLIQKISTLSNRFTGRN